VKARAKVKKEGFSDAAGFPWVDERGAGFVFKAAATSLGCN
jgi:hypothetical protein